MKVQSNWRRRFPWPALVALLLLGMLGVSVAGYSDTYNFYFDKKKNQNGDGEDKPEAAGPPAPAPQVTAPAGPTAPIVINNTNNVGVPGATTQNNVGVAAPAVPVAPVIPVAPVAPAAPVVAEVAHSRETFERPPTRSPWHVSLTGMAFLQKTPHVYIYGGQKEIYYHRDPDWGGLLSLGYNFSRSLGVNVYGGLRTGSDLNHSKYHAGVDLEIMPFRIPITEKVDILEIGFLVGGSTAMASPNNWGTLHAGARININVAPEFGITVSGRANLGYILLEGGLLARL